MVLFIQTYRRCFAAVLINVGNKCPPAQSGKQRLSSGVQAVEESKSEQRGGGHLVLPVLAFLLLFFSLFSELYLLCVDGL